jgi:hypothetical protein
LNSTSNSPIVEVQNNLSNSLDPIISQEYIEGIRKAKFEELLNDNSLVWNTYNKE